MSGIAQENRPPHAPVRQRLAIVQRLAKNPRGRRDDCSDRVAPAGVFCQRILDAPFSQPRLARRLFRAADADPVERASGRNIVLDDAPVGPHPDAGHPAQIEMRNPLRRDEPTPGDIAGVAGQLPPEDLRSHRRMDSVRTDEDVAGNSSAISERDGDTVCVLREPVDMRVQAETRVAEAPQEHIEQISAVGVIVRRTEMRLRSLAEWCPVEAAAIIPGPIVPSLRIDGHTCQCVTEAERPENPCSIGTELNAGSNLSESLRLLEQLRFDATLTKRQGRGDAANAAACDQDFETTHDFLLDTSSRTISDLNLNRRRDRWNSITSTRARTRQCQQSIHEISCWVPVLHWP